MSANHLKPAFPKKLSFSNACQLKRFSERYRADQDFQEQVSADPQKTLVNHNIQLNFEEARFLWEVKFEKYSVFEFLQCYQELQKDSSPLESIKSEIIDSASDSRYKMWRKRQIARTSSQFKNHFQETIAHAPICFELTKGCSVGCWFCGVSALRLSDVFVYSEQNMKLWREVLVVVKEVLDFAAGTGFCYWATDPLDNPDYEKFCVDFYEILGKFPQTTTAQPLKDPRRTRTLLKLSKEKGCPTDRFSVLSLNILNQVHEEFTAEELAFVNLVLQNKESGHVKANAGRSRERNLKNGQEDSEFPEQGTIACVTGFLFNMVDRSVKLISPCNASDHWPLGYIVYDEGTFSDADDLKVLLEKMISDNMPLSIRLGDRIAFRRDLEYENMSDGFKVFTKFKTLKFRHTSYIRELGEVIFQGNKTGEEILAMFEARGISSVQILHSLNLLFERGLLDNEPQPKDSENVS